MIGSAFARNNLAEILVDQGRLNDAVPQFQDAQRAFRAAGFTLGDVATQSSLGTIALRQGRLDEATQLLDNARRGFSDLGADSLVLHTDVRRLELILWRDGGAAALEAAAALHREIEAFGGVPHLLVTVARLRGLAHLELGHDDRAIEELANALALAEDHQAQVETILCLDALAELQADKGHAERRDELARALGIGA